MRVMVYSQDGLGLGHLRRTHNIVLEVLARQPDANVLILSDAPAAPFLSITPGIENLKLPTIVKTGSNEWQNASLSVGVEQIVNLRAAVILQAYRWFMPDLVLIDHMPVGALGELKPLFDAIVSGEAGTRLFLGLRDVIDSPEVIRGVWMRLGAYEYLPLYEQVFIYGCRDIYDADTAYSLTPAARQVTYCNYVTSGSPARAADERGERADDPFILLTGGGGHDAFPLMRAFIDAIPAIWRQTHLPTLVLTGPTMPADQREALAALADSYPIQVRGSVGDARRLLQQAAVVVTMAGYNTLCEVLEARKKALVVPRAGPSAEQRLRSSLFAQRRLIRMVDPDELTPRRLADELIRLVLDEGLPRQENIPPLDGAARAAALLTGGLGATEADTSTVAVAAGG